MVKLFKVLCGVLLAIAYVLCVCIATWDRPEAMAPYMVVLTACVLLIVIFLFKERGRGLCWIDLWIVVLTAYFGWRACISPVQLYAQTDLAIFLTAVGGWFSVRFCGIKIAILRTAWVWLMLLLLVLNACASWYQMHVDLRWCLFVDRSERMAELSGIFTHRNYFGNFAVVAAISCLGVLLGDRSRVLMRVVSAVVVVGNLVLLGLCASRGAYVSVTTGLIVFALLYGIYLFSSGGFKKSKFAIAVVILTLFGSAFIYAQFGRLGAERGWGVKGGGVRDTGRKDFSSLAVDQFFESPLIGSGAHSVEWRSVSLLTERGEWAAGTLNYAHNEYFQVLCDYGLLGFLLLVVLLVWLGGSLLYSLLSRGDLVWGMAVFAAFVAFCVHCLFSFPAHIPANLLTIVSVCALGFTHRGVNGGIKSKFIFAVPVSCFLLAGAAYGVHFAKKEFPAFWVYTEFNETMEFSTYEPELREQAMELENVVSEAPNFRRYQRLGQMYEALYQMSGNAPDSSLSGDYYIKAASLYPMSPALRLNEARVLALRGDSQKAEEAFEFVVENGVSQSKWLFPKLVYGQYCSDRGEMFWLQRESSRALAYFLKARDLLAEARPPHEERKRLRELRKELDARIDLLTRVGVEPAF
jgi:O-antigen ligase